MKKSFLYQLFILATFASLIACGNWSQDPLKDARKMGGGNQKPPDTKPDKPIASDFLKIDSPLFKIFKEAEQGDFDISARVNADGDWTISLKVTNLSSFDGATFANGKFTWTPPVGTAGDEVTELPLDIEAIASLPGKPVIKTTMKTIIGVTRGLVKPTITQVSAQQSTIREGESDYLYVTVEDQTVTATSPTTDYPRLVVQNLNGSPSIAPFVTVNAPSKLQNGQFQFYVQVNLQDAELTDQKTSYGASLVPVSHLNFAGKEQNLVYSVLTSLSNVTSTWATDVTAKAGSKIDFQFLVIDPKGEGNVELSSTGTLPTGATLTCPNAYKPYLNCRFVWDVPANTPVGSKTIRPSFITRSKDYSDTYTVSTTLNFPIVISGAR